MLQHLGIVFFYTYNAFKMILNADFLSKCKKTPNFPLMHYQDFTKVFFRKTRHENLILFMGACAKPPRLAIVTSLCKGNTLYTHLHLRKDKFYMNKVILIAQQIAQGMGYLHHKGIVHKDLKTKNIFLENGRAIITDFGLVNVARRLCSRHKKPGEKGNVKKSSRIISTFMN